MKSKNMSALLWSASFILAIGLLFARIVFPEITWLTIVIGVLLVGAIGGLVRHYRAQLGTRSAAFGLQSIVTSLLVISIVGVVNFIAVKYPKKIDLTKNKLNTLSDQSVKAVKAIDQPMKAVVFVKSENRDQIRSLLANYKTANPKLEDEYVDPDKEPARTKQAGIKSLGTVILTVGTRESRIENIDEEKFTNALLKLSKSKALVVCSLVGHGEKDMNAAGPEGYETLKKTLQAQSYEVQPVDFVAAREVKIPEACQALLILGPTKAFFPEESKVIREYIANGGRALFALDINVKANPVDPAPEMTALLKDWHVDLQNTLVIDPVSRVMNFEPTMPLIATYSKESPITKELQGNSVFPLTRSMRVIENAPSGMKVRWLTQSTPNAWGETNMASLVKGQVQFEAGDMRGPVYTGLSVEGKQKDSKAARDSRIVVFGTANFATNQFARFGNNLDLFANAVTWLLDDESQISIRKNTEAGGIIELDQRRGSIVFLVTIVIIPLLLTAAGIAIWAIRRRL